MLLFVHKKKIACFLALALVAHALVNLLATTSGLEVERVQIGSIPATVFRPAGGGGGPAVVIAHGFAGSQQLMQPFATTLARNGYVAVTFDFPGHGRNPAPLTGDIAHVEGATRVLVKATAEVAAYARRLSPGPIAVLGHSMASDIVVRFAEETPDVAATIAVSMFSPAVTEAAPRDLLVIVGAWEPPLEREALRVLSLHASGGREGVTYGDPAAGTARRVAFSPHSEHVSVLYSQASMREAVAWLDSVFQVKRTAPPYLDSRGGWIGMLIAGIVLAGWPLARLLPVVSAVPLGGGAGWRRLAVPLLVPAVATPLLLRVVPTHFLPVIVGDYLAVHFAVYGLLTLAFCWRGVRWHGFAWRIIAAAALVGLYAVGVLGMAIDQFVTSFMPGTHRVVLVVAMLAGTLPYFLADEWLTRGPLAGRLAYPASKLAFLVSLAIAVALDFERLFFLAIIVPVILLFFVVYGLFSRWAYGQTGHPFVGAFANAVGFAWAIGVTFPLVAG